MKSSHASVVLTVEVDILNFEQFSGRILSPLDTSLHQGSNVISISDVDFQPGLSQEEIHQIPVVTTGSVVKSGPEMQRIILFLSPPVDIRSPRQEDSGQLQVSFHTGIQEEISDR